MKNDLKCIALNIFAQSAPFLKQKNTEELTGTNDDYEGFIKDLLDSMGRNNPWCTKFALVLFDFDLIDSGHTYQLVFPQDGRYGMLDERTGNWTGLVKMLQDKVEIPI